MPLRRRFLLLLALVALVTLPILGAGPTPRTVWNELGAVENAVVDRDPATPDPIRYRSFAIDLASFRDPLRSAGLDTRREDASAAVVIWLPMPDGRLARFRALESPILDGAAKLAMPDVRAYSVRGIDDRSAYGRIDLTRLGLRAWLETREGSVMIDPLVPGRTDRVMSYWTRDEAHQEADFDCGVQVRPPALKRMADAVSSLPETRRGDTLRTYRIVAMGTAEFNSVYGGDTLVGMAQLATAVNRINIPYERDLGVHFVAVLIKTWPDSTVDPFDNPSTAGNMTERGQAVSDSLIGNGGFDAGMLLHHRYLIIDETLPTAYTGAGYLPAIGNPPSQFGLFLIGGSWVTPTAYRVIEHEIGHNFSCYHAWDAPCNRTPPYAYEPGSGSTIMGRAGRCVNYNVQADCDHYFHTWSLQEAYSWMEFIAAVGTHTPTGNTPPVAEAGPNYIIPRSTPFVLTGNATDDEIGGNPADTDTLRYCWEQFDQSAAMFDSISGPLFRSKNPTLDRRRYFPEIPNLLSGQVDPWNRLAHATRVLNFRLTVRGVGPQSAGFAYDSMRVTVSGAPFFVTAPNGGGTINRSSPLNVTWTVGGGIIAPTVNILYSEDGGLSWIPLVFATPNDGAQTVNLPGSGTITTCRIKIAAVGNIFFDVSNSNFTVTGTTVDAGPSNLPAAFALRTPEPNPARASTTIGFDLPRAARVDLAVYSVQGQRVRTLSSASWPAGRHQVTWNGTRESGDRVNAGVYFVRLEARGSSAMRRVVLLE